MFHKKFLFAFIATLVSLPIFLLFNNFTLPALNCQNDGIPDDTVCLQNLIDTQPEVTLPSGGTFRISYPLVIKKEGRIFDGASSRLINIREKNAGPLPILIVEASKVEVKNFWFDQSLQGAGAATIEVRSVPGLSTADVSFSNNYFTGENSLAALYINWERIKNVSFLKNVIANGMFGVLLDNRARDLDGLTVNGNNIQNISADGIEINSPVLANYQIGSTWIRGSGQQGAAAKNIRIMNNIINASLSRSVANGFCIGIAGAVNVIIQNNILTKCKWQGIHIEDLATNVTIVGNLIQEVVGFQIGDEIGWKDHSDGILLLNSRKIYIMSNWIQNVAANGIELSYSLKEFNSEVAICGNTIQNSKQNGLLIGGQADHNLTTWVGPIPNQGCGPNRIDQSGLKAVLINGKPMGLSIQGNTNF